MHITHQHIDVTAPCTMHICNVHTKKHMCTCVTVHTHTRMSGHTYNLSVWMCARVYMCVTNVRLCVRVYVCLYHTCIH